MNPEQNKLSQPQQGQPLQPQAPQPAHQPQSVDPLQSDTAQTFLPTKNKFALFSYYFGVFGLVPFLGLGFTFLAIVFGFVGLSKFKQNPTPGAKGHAITGIVLGFLQLAIFATFLIFMFIDG